MGESLSCLSVVLGLVVLFIVLVVWAVVATQRDAKRENRLILEWAQEKQEAREEREALWTIAAAWEDVAAYFPFLPPPEPESSSPEDLMRAAARRLMSVPSLGTFTHVHLPAPCLPPAERRRHLYVVGKTGSGKTTFLEHLMLRDLESGHGVGVMAPEGELFRSRLLPLMPASRRGDVIYFAPGDPRCPLTFNPLQVEEGDDSLRAAEDLFTIFKRALSGDELGPRMQPILQNAFAVLIGRPGVTLWDVKRLLTDASFRQRIVRTTEDPYIREFWEHTFPRFAKGSDLPLLTRLDHFLRPPAVRRSLCHPVSSFSIRQALSEKKVLLVDLFGLSEETRAVLGQMLLSKFQIELMRRELRGITPPTFFLFCDEFQTFAGFAEGVWRELLSRGRKYGLALTLAHQFPAQLPTALQEEIFGNVNSMISFALGSKDAQAVRKEFLTTVPHKDEVRIEPIPLEELLELRTGEAYAKLAGGRAVKLDMPAPLVVGSRAVGESVIAESWQRYAAPAVAREVPVPEEKEAEIPPPVPVPPQPAPVVPTATPTPPIVPSVTAPVPQAPSPLVAKPAKKAPAVAPPITAPVARPPAQPVAPLEQAPAAEPRRPGKGGPEHTYLQELIKRSAEEHGFRAVVEEQVAGGKESVDVALYRGDLRIACEITVTTPLEYEVGNVQKCLAAGFGMVAVVSPKKTRLAKLDKLLSESLSPEQYEKVRLLAPEELLSWLSEQPYYEEKGTVRGYKVKVRYRNPGDDRLKRVAEILARSMNDLQKDK